MIERAFLKLINTFRTFGLNHSFNAGYSASEFTERNLKFLKLVPGWFNIDDFSHFHLILNYQNFYKISGDILEIGSYHGKSTAVLSLYLREGELLHVCDAFKNDTTDAYSNKPSMSDVTNTISLLNDDDVQSKIRFYNCLSRDLVLDDQLVLKFIHIDGGHNYNEVINDLEISNAHLAIGGIIAIDDYGNRFWPEVQSAVDDYLKRAPELTIFADLNRFRSYGRKLYLIKKSSR